MVTYTPVLVEDYQADLSFWVKVSVCLWFFFFFMFDRLFDSVAPSGPPFPGLSLSNQLPCGRDRLTHLWTVTCGTKTLLCDRKAGLQDPQLTFVQTDTGSTDPIPSRYSKGSLWEPHSWWVRTPPHWVGVLISPNTNWIL